MRLAIICCLLGASLYGFANAGFSCDYPDEGGMPLHRAVTKVKLLPEVDTWAAEMRRDRVSVQYLVRLDEPVHEHGRGAVTCYWPVEVRADGKVWRRFLVSPDGRSVRHD